MNEVRINPELPGDSPLADPVLAKVFHFWHELTCSHWPPVELPGFRKHGQHAGLDAEQAAACGGIARHGLPLGDCICLTVAVTKEQIREEAVNGYHPTEAFGG
jgi:hypothetical protein